MEEGQPLEHRWLNRSIETAQRRVEQQNFSIRRRTLEYDDVMNRQREVIYDFRGEVVRAESPRELLYEILQDVIAERCEEVTQENTELTRRALVEWLQTTFPIAIRAEEIASKSEDGDALCELIFDRVKRAYELKVSTEDPGMLNNMERHIILQSIDTHWQEYLRGMDVLRQGVGLRAYGQRDPLVEYKREAFDMFATLMDDIKEDVAGSVFRSSTSVESFESFMSSLPQTLIHDEVSLLGRSAAAAPAAAPAGARRPAAAPLPPGLDDLQVPDSGAVTGMTREGPKVGRNDPCPCGSGKKYKKCCGA
jgi:preprotein translocase subunit SecA